MILHCDDPRRKEKTRQCDDLSREEQNPNGATAITSTMVREEVNDVPDYLGLRDLKRFGGRTAYQDLYPSVGYYYV